MKARRSVLLIFLLIAITSGCGEPKTNHIAVRDAYDQAIEAGDLDAALALFTDDALIMSPMGHFRGKEDIRWALENDFGLPEALKTLERLNVEETEDTLDFDETYLDWDGITVQLHHAYLLENGKIKEWRMTPF